MKKIFIFLFIGFILQSYSQNAIELKFDEKCESTIIGAYLKENNLYVLNFEKLNLDNTFYALYKIDLDSKKVLNRIKIEEGKIYNNPYFKEDNDSIYILNKSTFDDFATYYAFDLALKTHKKIIKTKVAEYVKVEKLLFFKDFKNNIIYIDGEPIKQEMDFSYFCPENKSVYFFESSYKTKNISFSKVDSQNTLKNTYTFKELPDYENDFAQYSKFRNNTNFFSSANYIFITPEVGKNPINIESFYYLKFNKTNASLVKSGIPKIENLIDCNKIKVLSKSQYIISTKGKTTTVQFGVDKDQNFCICKSNIIEENFYYQDIQQYKQENLYIGSNYKTKTAKIYFE
ncbi:hypothetical protein OD917_08670 [Flavobacterium sp. SH_e]|uniref:hypothetical protein n=1 Tax=Flavobacterium TaxID=237 RepID=UPI0021E391D0|nr:hypothetical protein [Flavobacterium sp. SH_e]MCV2484993.1 hypothetical protein [Flavobacterium sp. SH_e]